MKVLEEAFGAPSLTDGRPVEPGESAPDFTLPALHREGMVSLADYRGRTALLVAIERGLYCPFCRRHLAQLGATAQKLAALGVEVLAVVGTPPERARAYLKFRPTRVPLVADPKFETHRAYGLPKFADTAQTHEVVEGALINPFGDPEPKALRELAGALDHAEPYEWNDSDQHAYDLEQVQTTGQFLIDRLGIVRWRHIEGERGGLADLARFPSDEELVAQARAIAP